MRHLSTLFALLSFTAVYAQPDSIVTPLVSCVEETDDGYRAYFGYETDGETVVNVPRGEDNRFQGGRTDDEPIEDFELGSNEYAFAAEFPNRLTWSIRTGGTKRMVRADQRHPLFNQCDPPLSQPEVEVGSAGTLTVSGLSEQGFNPVGTVLVSYALEDAVFSADSLDHVLVINDEYVGPEGVTASTLTFRVALRAGRNDLALYSADTAYLGLTSRLVAWAGSATQAVRVVDANGAPVNGARVRFAIVDDLEVGADGVTSGGQVSFTNVPPRTLIATAEDDANRFGTAGALGNGQTVTVEVLGFDAPSPIDNNDFSLGTDGWDVTSGIAGGIVQIVPHEEAPGPGAPGMADAAVSGMDLLVGTGPEGPQRVSRTFEVSEGVSEVTVRYRFVTSEVPGGYYGSEFNDYFGVTARSQGGGGRASESASMNGLGLEAFTSDGATAWREISLPVNEAGDLIQIDALVANVGDGAFDSQLVLDLVEENPITIASVQLQDRIPPVRPYTSAARLSPLQYISLANHPFYGGFTRVWGSVTVRGEPDDQLEDLILSVDPYPGSSNPLPGGSLSSAAANQLPQTFGSDGTVTLSMTGSEPLFEIPGFFFFDNVAPYRVPLTVFAYATSGSSAEKGAGTASLLRYYDGANRFSRSGDPRDNIVGGDSWAQPSAYAFAQGLSSDPASSDFLFNDFANMNGGPFPPHSGHSNGFEMDTATPRVNTGVRDATTANRLVAFLNGPYGEAVEIIGITYTSSLSSALSGVTLNDGRSARAVIRNWSAHTHHFHIRMRQGWTPASGRSLVAASSTGQAWTTRGPRTARRPEAALRTQDAAVSFSVSPNPSRGRQARVRITVETPVSAQLRVYDAMGREVVARTLQLTTGGHEITLEAEQFAPGVYIAVLDTDRGERLRQRFTLIR
ncbi:MAG: hypothetical protein CMM84_19665 [Rhodothermaceae bacterium]|nr:hypothetical protein [Rhodothermaceae bacterium]MAS53164.1 hypothetical protein [Pimelobacter sp.]